MVRSLLLGCATLVAMAVAATPPAVAAASNPLITWQGSVTLLSKTVACDAIPGFDPGILASSIFRPQLDVAEPKSALTITLPRGTLIFTNTSAENQMRGAGNYSGIWISSRATATTSVTGTYNFAIRPVSAITSATQFVLISGTITKWAAIPGCTVTLRGAYVRRPN